MLAAVAVIAVIARGIYLAEIRSSPFFEVPVVDAESYVTLARQIAAGDLAGGAGVYWQPPLYPYFLALLEVLSVSALGTRVVQFLLGTATAVLVARLGAMVAGRRAGWIAGVAAALYGPFILFEGRLLAPALILITNVAGLVLLERASRHPGVGPRAIAGVVFGLATVARPDAFFVAFVLACGLLIAEWRRPAGIEAGAPGERLDAVGRSGALARAIVFIAAALLVTLPVTARNWAVAGDWVWISANGGINFYLGNNPHSDETVAIRPGREWARLVETPHREAGLTRASDRSRYFYREALTFIAREPAAYASLAFKKAGRFLAGLEIRRNEDPYALRGESRLLSLLLWRVGRLGFPFGLVVPLAIMGTILLWSRRRELLLIHLYAIAYGVVVVAFFVTARYRLPAVPALLILAAGAIDWFITHRRVPGAAIRFLTALVFLAVLVNFNPAVQALPTGAEHWRLVAIAEHDRGRIPEAVAAQARAIRLDPERAELVYDQGNYLTAAGDTAGAIAAYERAIELEPDYAEAKVNLGNLLVLGYGDYGRGARLFIEAAIDEPNLVPAQIAVGRAFLHSGHADSALARFEHALALDPGNVPAALGKISALRRVGRPDLAVAAAREAIAASGESADLLTALGQGLMDAGRYEEAVAVLRASLAREPREPAAWVTIGQCYRHLGRLEEAEKAQKRALELDPQLVAAHVNLADVYARRGVFDQAIATLERALALDPFNTTAIFNLAVVHTQLGEEPTAIVLLEKLLEIDPGHGPGKHALSHLRGEDQPGEDQPGGDQPGGEKPGSVPPGQAGR